MILNRDKLQTKWTEFSFILKPSILGGVGVFSIHDMPAETPLFSGKPSSRKMKIKDIPADFLKYCIFVNDDECLCPERFDCMGIGWYINHSSDPNIGKNTDGFVTICAIKAGDEILLDYHELNEPENLKEAYSKASKN